VSALPAEEGEPEPSRLDALFAPTSVAVLGASEDPAKWGNWLAVGALRGEHRRAVHLVNRRGGTVLGRRAFVSVAEIGQPVDLAVLAVPAESFEEAANDALDAGARALIGITTGKPAGTALLARIRESDAVLLGPNCMGVFDAATGLELVPEPLPAGPVAFLSQSGNLALELAAFMTDAGIGFSRFVSLGDQAELAAAALLRDLIDHAPTRAIMLYLEDFGDGRALASAAAAARAAGKRVLLLCPESSEAAQRAARSHTAALTSDAAAIDAACEAAGIERVRTLGELAALACAALAWPTPARGRRVGLVSDGGGHAAIASGCAERAGLEVPAVGPDTERRLREVLPQRAAVANPIDLAGDEVGGFARAAETLVASGEVDMLLVTGYLCGYERYGERAAAAELETIGRLAALARHTPMSVHTMHPDTRAARELRGTGVPVYRDVEAAVAALARIARPDVARGAGRVPLLPAPTVAFEDLGYSALRGSLARAGIPFIAAREVYSRGEALEAAADLGFPIVLKALGRLHKSDAGGVAIGLSDAGELEAAFEDMRVRLDPPAFSVERMADLAGGTEMIIGARWDPRFGALVMVGAGGINAEMLRDVAVALAPIDHDHALELLRRLRVAALLAGARGRPQLDVEAAAGALVVLSEVAAEHPEIAELEINPLLVCQGGVIALDARAVAREPLRL